MTNKTKNPLKPNISSNSRGLFLIGFFSYLQAHSLSLYPLSSLLLFPAGVFQTPPLHTETPILPLLQVQPDQQIP